MDGSNRLPTRGAPTLRFTPTLNDQSGLRFTPFLDDHLIRTPNSNYALPNYNPVFHGPAGDLHTPLVESNLMTPKTLLEQFAVTPLHRNNIDPFHDTSNVQYFAQESQNIAPDNQNAAYPPSAFVHSDLVDGAIDGMSEAAPVGDAHNQGNGSSQLVTPQDSLFSPERYQSRPDNNQ